MAFHHIHNQDIRHTRSFVVTGRMNQCSDTVGLAVSDADNDNWSESPFSGVRK